MTRITKQLLWICCMIALTSCDKINDLLLGEMIPPGLIMLKQDIKLQRLRLMADKDANNSRPFSFHIVLTKNLQMAQDLSQMSSVEYFKAEHAKAFDKNYHGMYKIFKYSIRPGEQTPEYKLKIDPSSKYVGGYFFANFHNSKGDYKIRIPSDLEIMVKFTVDGMTLVMPDFLSEGIEKLENKIGIVP